jgi:Ras-related protein Rab-35
VVYDVSSGDSFANVKRWLHEIDANCDVVNRILVGNKNDDPDRKVVLTEDARRFADQMGIKLFETSAKDNINVEEMFRSITTLVLKSKKDQKERQDDPAKIDLRNGHRRPNQNARVKSKCCK